MLDFLPPIASAIRPPAEAWRADTGLIHDDDTTAAAVIRHEQTHGQLLDLTAELVAFLAGFHADALLWVTFKRSHAARYGQPLRVPIDSHAYVIGQDGAGGFLLFFPNEPTITPREFFVMSQEPSNPAAPNDDPTKAKTSTLTHNIHLDADVTGMRTTVRNDAILGEGSRRMAADLAAAGAAAKALHPDDSATPKGVGASNGEPPAPRHSTPSAERGVGHYEVLKAEGSTARAEFSADLAQIQEGRIVKGDAPAERAIVPPTHAPSHNAAAGSDKVDENPAAKAVANLKATMKELAKEDAPSAREQAAEALRQQGNDESSKRQEGERRANAGETAPDAASEPKSPAQTAKEKLAATMKELAGDRDPQGTAQDTGRAAKPSTGRGMM
jgi:hypothetical protein